MLDKINDKYNFILFFVTQLNGRRRRGRHNWFDVFVGSASSHAAFVAGLFSFVESITTITTAEVCCDDALTLFSPRYTADSGCDGDSGGVYKQRKHAITWTFASAAYFSLFFVFEEI